MFKLLSVEETKELVQIAEPVEIGAWDLFRQQPHLQSQIQGWYRTHGIEAGMSKDKKTKLTELFGTGPQCTLNIEYQTSIWGFSYEGHNFVIGSSTRGTSIELAQKFPKDLIEPLLKGIRKTLVNPSYRDKWFYTKKLLKDLERQRRGEPTWCRLPSSLSY